MVSELSLVLDHKGFLYCSIITFTWTSWGKTILGSALIKLPFSVAGCTMTLFSYYEILRTKLCSSMDHTGLKAMCLNHCPTLPISQSLWYFCGIPKSSSVCRATLKCLYSHPRDCRWTPYALSSIMYFSKFFCSVEAIGHTAHSWCWRSKVKHHRRVIIPSMLRLEEDEQRCTYYSKLAASWQKQSLLQWIYE